MEEYITPSSSSHQSVSIAGSTSDLSEIGSVYSLSAIVRQRSDSLTNLFNMSEDSASLSNLSVASYTLSQHSCDYGLSAPSNTLTTTSLVSSTPSPVAAPPTSSHHYQSVSSSNATSHTNGSDKMSRKQYSSSYRNLTEEPGSPSNFRVLGGSSRRSGDGARHHHFCATSLSGGSSTSSSQKSFPIKTAETVLNTIGINTALSGSDLTDKCGLIANDGNDIENNDDDDDERLGDDVQSFCDGHYVDSSDENELDLVSTKTSSLGATGTTSTTSTSHTGRGLRKTVLNNVDRLLNSGNKQIKL